MNSTPAPITATGNVQAPIKYVGGASREAGTNSGEWQADYVAARDLMPSSPANFFMKKTPKHKCKMSMACICSSSALEPEDRCPVHGCEEFPARCGVCGKFMKYWHVPEGIIAKVDI